VRSHDRRRAQSTNLSGAPSSFAGKRIAVLRSVVDNGLKALAQYDRFLRERTTAERLWDISVFRYLDTPSIQLERAEAAEFWGRLSEVEKRSFVAEWLRLLQRGHELAGPGKYGGVGEGYGPSDYASPSKAAAVIAWGSQVQALLGRLEKSREETRIAVRVEGATHAFELPGTKTLKSLGTWLVIGVIALGAFAILTRRR
jgi:hypothetical protein